jgi:hypothetical protein
MAALQWAASNRGVRIQWHQALPDVHFKVKVRLHLPRYPL